jgi:hypothetical protein
MKCERGQGALSAGLVLNAHCLPFSFPARCFISGGVVIVERIVFFGFLGFTVAAPYRMRRR